MKQCLYAQPQLCGERAEQSVCVQSGGVGAGPQCQGGVPRVTESGCSEPLTFDPLRVPLPAFMPRGKAAALGKRWPTWPSKHPKCTFPTTVLPHSQHYSPHRSH